MSCHSWTRAALVAALAALPLLPATAPVQAQETGRITGLVTVVNTDRPLAGAQVFIPGTAFGTITSSEGRYLLPNVPVGTHTVSVRLVGYAEVERTVEVTADAAATVDFELRQEAIALDEIVVTGAGQATERRRLGNSIGAIDAGELETAPIATVSDALQGREPGVIVQQSGGIAGEGSTIRIRGSASLSQSNEPIVYVDGMRINSEGGFGEAGAASRLDDLDPSSIERVEILKGAAAATLYGTEASNGVIQIFTKDGAQGDTRWTFTSEWGLTRQDRNRYEPLAGFVIPAEDTIHDANAIRYEAISSTPEDVESFWGVRPEPYEVFEADMQPILFETGMSSAHSLSASGGNELMTYYVSGRLASEDGTFGAEEYGPARDLDQQRQATANVTIFPFENMRLRLNSQYVDRHRGIPTNGNDIFGGFSLTMMGKPELSTENNPGGAFSFTSLPEMMQIEDTEDTERFAGGITATYTPLSTLEVHGTFGLDMTNLQGIAFRPFGWNVSGIANDNPQGDRFVNDRNHRQYTVDLGATWDQELAEDFSSSLVAGAQVLMGHIHQVDSDGEQFPAPGLEVTGAGSLQSANEFIQRTVQTGVFVQEQVGFRDYLFTTLGLRYDKHSAFGETAGGAIYPKLSVSLVASDMPGWSSDLLPTLRLRGAIGQSGLQPGAFDKFTTYEPLPSESGPGVEPDNLGNAELEPEVSTEWELGGELGLLDNRLALDATYWNRTVENVLIQRQFSPSGGFLSTQLDNLGEMKAWGLELGANGTVYSGDAVSVDLFASGSFLREEVTDMGVAPPLKIGYYRYRNWVKGPEDLDGDGEPDRYYAPGAFFGPRLADPSRPFDFDGDGEPDSRAEMLDFFSGPRLPEQLALALADEDGDGDFLDHYLGKPLPDWQGSFGTRITFLGDFSLNTNFEYRAGNYFVHDLLGAFRNAHIVLGRNTPETASYESTMLNPESSPEERMQAAIDYANVGHGLDPYSGLNSVKPADYIRWREASLTYHVPTSVTSRFGANSLRVTAAARNLMLWTKYTGIDPESNVVSRPGGGGFLMGVDGWRPGIPARFTLSANLGF